MKEYIIEDFIASRKLAVINNGELEKIIIEEKNKSLNIKNIYRGKVEKIISTMDACFVDIGERNPAYLKVSKDEKIQEGERILVQVKKEEKGDKRAKVSREIDFSGRHLVYIPSNTKLVFSSKIKDNDEKKRLKKLVLEASNGEKGFIVRTEAQGQGIEELKKDIEELKDKYDKLVEEYESSFYPKLLYKDKGSIFSYIKENLSEEVYRIVYVDGEINRPLRDLVKSIKLEYLEKLKKEKNIDIFEAYGVNNMLKKYTSRNVWLKSGAYIVIDKTEAMTVIDVNTGSFKGKSGYEDTVYNVNIEAAEEISKQIIMRDISGIIIVDFIDMQSRKNKNMLLEKLSTYLEKEGKRSKVHGFTKLGLVEISRMRKEKSLDQYFDSENRDLDIIERKVIYEKYHLGKERVEIEKKNIDLDNISDKLNEIEKKYNVNLKFI